jgi:hypothetical protein
MNTNTPPPCAGMSWLFDSTDARSHAEARAICSTCPVIAACRDLLRETQRTQLIAGPNGGPEGTWAGVLFKAKGRVVA